jgi:hypothetical protein
LAVFFPDFLATFFAAFFAGPFFASSEEEVEDMSTPNFFAADLILVNAAFFSGAETPLTWSKRAMALRTCEGLLSGSLRSLGKA